MPRNKVVVEKKEVRTIPKRRELHELLCAKMVKSGTIRLNSEVAE